MFVSTKQIVSGTYAMGINADKKGDRLRHAIATPARKIAKYAADRRKPALNNQPLPAYWYAVMPSSVPDRTMNSRIMRYADALANAIGSRAMLSNANAV